MRVSSRDGTKQSRESLRTIIEASRVLRTRYFTPKEKLDTGQVPVLGFRPKPIRIKTEVGFIHVLLYLLSTHSS